MGTSIQAQEIVFAQVTYHPNDSETWVTNSGLNFSPAGLLHYYFMQIQKDEGVYTMKDTSVGDTHYEAPPKI